MCERLSQCPQESVYKCNKLPASLSVTIVKQGCPNVCHRGRCVQRTAIDANIQLGAFKRGLNSSLLLNPSIKLNASSMPEFSLSRGGLRSAK